MLDTLGKWSLVDGYLLIMTGVSFRYHIGRTINLFDDKNEGNSIILNNIDGVTIKFEVDEIATPLLGFYEWLVGTILSLIATHWLIY